MQAQSHTYATSTQPQRPAETPTLRVKTHVKAGRLTANHNETLVQALRPAGSLQVKTHVKAGSLTTNHNETLVHASRSAVGLQVKTHVKAGYPPGPSRS